MKGLNLYLADGNFAGTVTMSSGMSQVTAIRVSREEMAHYENELDGPGIYLLFIGTDSVYVGQTGLDTLSKRIINTHSGDIDASWHTVMAFKFINKNISQNELEFIENAMCEYAHSHYKNCITASPTKSNCNVQYRNKHYHLNSQQIHFCNQFISDIEFYISVLSDHPEKVQEITNTDSHMQTELFYYSSKKRDVEATAVIAIHTGSGGKRKTIVKAGSRISNEVSPSFSLSQKISNDRRQKISEGKIINRILQEDLVFPSQSYAASFVNGASMSGNDAWKTVKDNIKLGKLLV